MPKKAKAGAASGKTAAKVKNTSDSGNEEDCNCVLCCEPVKDDEDDGLYCEGACAQWFHRYCAGVTVPQFERLSSSSSPFLCYACFQEEQRAKVSSLEDKVAALTAELSELKTVLESRRETGESQSWSTVVRRGAQRQQRGSRSKPSNRQVPQRFKTTASTSANGNPHQASLTQSLSNHATASECARKSDTVGESNGSKSPKRIPVDGVRRVWGTLRNTTTTAVRSALAKLSPASAENITVRRKFREYRDSNKTRWWFILRGEENSLKMLELDWERIRSQTNWKLEHCFSAGLINQTHASLSSASPGAKDSPDSISTKTDNTSSPVTTDDTRVHNRGNSNLQTENIDVNNSSLSDPQDATGSQPQQPSHSFLITNHGQEAKT